MNQNRQRNRDDGFIPIINSDDNRRDRRNKSEDKFQNKAKAFLINQNQEDEPNFKRNYKVDEKLKQFVKLVDDFIGTNKTT